MSLGMIGCAISMSFTSLINLIIIHVYTSLYLEAEKRDQAWFSMFKGDKISECFDKQGLLQYYKIGISAIGMLSIEWWCFEIMMI
jgi:hypothetical protein